MKRLLAWILLTLLLALPACGQTPAPPVAEPDSEAASSHDDGSYDENSSDKNSSDENTPEESPPAKNPSLETDPPVPGEPVEFDELVIPVYPEPDPLYRADGEDGPLPTFENPWGLMSDEEIYYGRMHSDRTQRYPAEIMQLLDALPEEVSIEYGDKFYPIYEVDESYDVPLSAFHYKVNKDGTSCTITKIDGIENARVLIVPFYIDGLRVTGIGERVCAESSLKIVKALGVSNIGKGAFANCRELYMFTWGGGDSLLEIGDYAFFQCKSLTVFPFVYAASIGEGAFKHCISLTDVRLSENLVKLGQSAFADCSELSSVIILGGETIDKDNRTILPLTFANCDSLQTVAIGGYVTGVEDYAFTGVWESTNVSFLFGEGVKEIGLLDLNPYDEGYIMSVKLPSTLQRMRTKKITELLYAGSASDFQKVALDEPLSEDVQVYYEYVNPYIFSLYYE